MEDIRYIVKCYKCDNIMKVEMETINIICDICEARLGYHADSSETIPKRDDTILIKKGTLIRSAKKGKYKACKTYQVKINHILNGTIQPFVGFFDRTLQEHVNRRELIMTHPSLVWAGTGGYWCEVDVNDAIW